jgi:hypothetical protein
MDIDWIVAIMVFLIFVGWSFSYYITLFPEGRGFLKTAADTDKERIIDFLSTDVYSVPVKVDSGGGSNIVLKAKGVWYYGAKNSTRVVKDSVSLQCRIVGDDLYWLANLSSGWNYFHIEFSEIDSGLECDSSFSLVNVTQTVPWTLEKREMISLSRINEMTNSSYEDFKVEVGVEEDFSVSLEWEGTKETYGKSLPVASDVYVRTYEGLVWENSKGINVSIRIW